MKRFVYNYLIASESQSSKPFQTGEHSSLQQCQVVARQLQRDEAFQALQEGAGESSSQSVITQIDLLQLLEAGQSGRAQLRRLQQIGAQLQAPQAGWSGEHFGPNRFESVAAQVEEAQLVECGERLSGNRLDAVVGQVESLEMDERAERFRRHASQSIVGQAERRQRRRQAGEGLRRHLADLARRDDEPVQPEQPLEQVWAQSVQVLNGQVQQRDGSLQRLASQRVDNGRHLALGLVRPLNGLLLLLRMNGRRRLAAARAA